MNAAGAPQLSTPIAGLVVRPLAREDAGSYAPLAGRNRAHLGWPGGAETEVDYRRAWDHDFLERSAAATLRYGIWRADELIGRVDLIPVAPPHYGLSYWLDKTATGHGYATAAVGAVLGFARASLGATDVFAGVAHGNRRSVAVLTRLGFQSVLDFETYTRFHLPLADGQPDRP
ncbi:GNAT family N-acetyltransferase [Actinopolymorpha alba]|uniref:GNAT family N-acetyltransferase n=1 Tax=Actinopolymorpha alba TaxID=533267 RepID=UPI00035CD452|nr:GNAT family N-acetyltransferase [Actinopolymorpha alba]